ncbi:MAG: carbon-monoxide dehydrogenase large subunit [Gammaproteobacteria bacterium]|jgi:carbon-monoxide dehydrogenase large subunit
MPFATLKSQNLSVANSVDKHEVVSITTRAIGQSVPRKEDATILTGRSQYIADIRLPGMLHVAFLRAPFAHAKILNIDSGAATILPGVELIWTGEDAARHTAGITASLQVENYGATTQPAMATDEVRYVGETIAAVVATSRRVAEDALELIDVDYEELPTVNNIHEAVAAENLANDEVANNVIFRDIRANDDVDAAFAAAATVVSGVFHNNRVSAAPIETRGCVARHEWTNGLLTLWSATQMPGYLRTILAMCLQIPEHTIEVITPQVGGGFGQKAHVHPEELVVCLLARELGIPVSWIEDRQENLLSATHAKHQINDMSLAFDANGKMLAMKNHASTDAGAYNALPWTASVEGKVGTSSITGVYKIPLAKLESLELATSKCPIGAYRGVGWTAGQIARESLIDQAARALELSPFEIRRTNIIQTSDFPYASASKIVIREGSFLETVDRLESMVDYPKFQERQTAARAQGKYLGLGISVFNEITGFGTRAFSQIGTPITSHDTATVRVDPTGTVTVTTSFVAAGQGHSTTFAQVAADALGVAVDKVVVQSGSTANTYGLGTFASRAAVIGTGSIARAAEMVRVKIRQIAGHMLEVSPQDIVFENDQVHVAGVPERGMSMADVAGAIYFAESTHPENFDPTLEATATYDPADAVLANGGHAAIVEVDAETGIVKIEKFFAVEDCGQMINPMIVEGQIRGGIAQAIGSSLLEELVHDDHSQLMTTTFMDYLLPSACDVPDIEIAHLCTPSALVPGGIKGMGESAMISAPAAVIGGVNDALACLGVFIQQYPISPDRVFQAIESAPNRG